VERLLCWRAGKGKAVPAQVVKAQRKIGGTSRHFLTSSLDHGEWVILDTGNFTRGKEPRYPKDRILGVIKDGMDILEYEENLLLLPGFEPQIIQPVP
jgi:hypothetical protein